MYWMHKVSWSGVLILAGIAKVREKEGDTLADAITIAATTISVTAIWYPEIRAVLVGAAVATPVVVPVAAVAATAYAVGGIIAFAAADPKDEGWYGAEALKEYYRDPLGTTKDIIVKEVTETGRMLKGIGTFLIRSGSKYLEENWLWANPTPGDGEDTF